jgi:phospholipid/cholesterol/gamma-HCH transport system permease protein
MQIYFTGYEALSIVGIISLALGVVLISQIFSELLAQFGLESYLERMIFQILSRELIPLILALVIIGRSGNAISTELSNMKLNREIETLEVLGINTDYLIVLPRIIGMTIAFMCLSLYSNIIAIFGGYLMSDFSFIFNPEIWIVRVLSNFRIEDILISVLKSGIFGAIISLITSFHGFSVEKSFTEVPKVATKAVVNSMVFCFCINVVITIFIFPTGLR